MARIVCAAATPTGSSKPIYALSWGKFLAGSGFVLLNWPLAMLLIALDRFGIAVALAATCGVTLILILIASRSRRANVASLALPIAVAGVMSIFMIPICIEFEASMSVHRAVYSGSEQDHSNDHQTILEKIGVPPWELKGISRETSLSAIPATATETIVCAMPITPENRSLASGVGVWVIETMVRRTSLAIFGVSDFRCLEGVQEKSFVVRRLPEHRRSSLVSAAIGNSVKKIGIVAAPQLLLLKISRGPRTPLEMPGYLYVVIFVALNAVYTCLLGFALRPSQE